MTNPLAASRRYHPLLPLAAGWLAGAWLGDRWGFPAAGILGGVGVAALLALGWLGARRGGFPGWLLLVAGLGLGAAHLAWHANPAADGPEPWADNRKHRLLLTLDRAPEPAPGGRLYLVARVLAADGAPAQGRLRLSLPTRPAPPLGRRVEASLTPRPFVDFANPGGFAHAQYMADQGLEARAWLGDTTALVDAGPLEPGPRLSLERLRAHLGGLLDRLGPGQGRELVRALLLGQRGGLDPNLREAMGAVGVAHLLAISGLHVGLVWGAAFVLLRLGLAAWPALALRWPAPRLAAILALGPAAAYAALAGGGTPTLRALIMTACLVAAGMAGRVYRPLGGLCLAALVIGIAWPTAPLGLSFHLSFLAVAALLGCAPPLARWAAGARGWRRWARGLAAWLATGLAIAVAIWPVSVGAFHQLPWLSPLANALLVPLVTMTLLPLLLLGALAALAWPAAGWWLWAGAVALGDLVVWLALGLAALPGAVVYLAGPGPGAALAFYAAALAAWLGWGRWRWPAAGAFILLFGALWAVGSRPPAPDGRLTVWVLDVGQGSAAVVRLPRGQVVVVDGGGWSLPDFDFGRAIMAPFLWSQGFQRVEVLAASHSHPDHAGGLAFLARWFDPAQIWTNGEAAAGGWYGRLLAEAARRGIPVRTPRDLGAEWSLGGARVRRLWPPPDQTPGGREVNNLSLWLGLGLGEAWCWLPGDNGPAVEQRLAPGLAAGSGGRHTVLVAPHHGGKGQLTGELLAALEPAEVVISAGCLNSFGMPRPEGLARSRAAGARVWGTGWHGALRLVSDGGAWRVTPHLDPYRRCPRPWPPSPPGPVRRQGD